MELRTTNKELIEEVPYGIYVWCMPDGKWVGDDDGNFLNIPAIKGDKARIKLLTEAVRGYGVEGGWALFLSGNRRVTDEEFEEQLQRQKFGLTPDPMDVPAIVEGRRNARK